MMKFFGFGSSTPPPPPPPSRPPSPPVGKTPAKAAPPPAPKAPGLVGQWKEPNGNDVTEFRADGTLLEKPASGEAIRGRYAFEGSKLKVNLEGVAEELSFTAVIKSDELEMTDADGQVTRYRRV